MNALSRYQLNDLIYDLYQLPKPLMVRQLESINYDLTLLLNTIYTDEIGSEKGRQLNSAILNFNNYGALINVRHNLSIIARKMSEDLIFIHDLIMHNNY